MKRRPHIQITGTGIYLPSREVTNDELATRVDTSDEWIRTRTGISSRRVACAEETATSMAVAAAEQALTAAGVTIQDVDLILVSTLTPDHLMPSTASEVQAAMGAPTKMAYDFAAACAGFSYGLQIAEAHIVAGHAQTVLFICVEKMSSILDWEDRSTCVLFGDGAGAVIVQPSTGEKGVLSTLAGADGRHRSALQRPAGGAAIPFSAAALEERSIYLQMDGSEVFKSAVRTMTSISDETLRDAGLSWDQVELLIPHQANQRILDSVAKHAGVTKERVYSNVGRYGNMSSASIPVALHEAITEGRLKSGDVALLVSFGAGFTWGAATLRY